MKKLLVCVALLGTLSGCYVAPSPVYRSDAYAPRPAYYHGAPYYYHRDYHGGYGRAYYGDRYYRGYYRR